LLPVLLLLLLFDPVLELDPLLDVVATGSLRRSPDAYLQAPRPPVLKEYFDPKIRKIVRLAPASRHVRVRFRTEHADVPENP
jgi:hypothetical protein